MALTATDEINVASPGADQAALSAAITDLVAISTISAPKLGPLGALGQPTGTPSAAENGAGSLTGTYQYAYTEEDGSTGGETILSAVASITVTSKTIRVTVPPPRRGVDRRKLYRTAAGGSTFKLVHDFGGAAGYFQTQWDDNTADGSLGATAPVADTSSLYSLYLLDGVKTLTTSPNRGSAPADLTVLTGDSGYTDGAYALDVYGSYYGRTYIGYTFGSLKTGTSDGHFLAQWQDVVDGGAAAVTVASLKAKGNLSLTPRTLSDPSLADGASYALSINATFPSAPTADAVAASVGVTSAGSAAYVQTAFSTSLAAGYTGASNTYGLRAANAVAGTGIAIGFDARQTGAAALGIGLAGFAGNGTKSMAVYGSGDGTAPSTSMFRSGIPAMGGAFTNGAGVGDIIVGLDNATPVFWVENGGDTTVKNVGSTTKLTVTNSGGGGILEMSAISGTSVKVRSTNNVDLILGANSADVLTIGTNGLVTFANGAKLRTYTVATLPTPTAGLAGVISRADDARNSGEGAAAGTGSTVECTGTIWKIPGISAAVAA